MMAQLLCSKKMPPDPRIQLSFLDANIVIRFISETLLIDFSKNLILQMSNLLARDNGSRVKISV